MDQYEKRGYLTENFKVFVLSDQTSLEVNYHYHDFDKIVFLISGNIEYTIEGKTYLCNEQDFIFVPHGVLHKLNILSNSLYDRIVIYFKPEFLNEIDGQINLGTCYDEIAKKDCNVLHFNRKTTERLHKFLIKYNNEEEEDKFAKELLLRTWMTEFLVYLNRAVLKEEVSYLPKVHENSKISAIFAYINQNLNGDLSVDSIAKELFMSRSYLMHLFKEETGETLASYITSRRLAYGRSLIFAGVSITEACYACGYKEYSTFLRAYRKKYGEAPSESRRQEVVD